MKPIAIEVEAGKTYWWCRCGQSATQPWCDGAHKGGAFSPQKYLAAESGPVWFCVCKKTRSPPLCDGSHEQTPTGD
jgi:CDGSH-type Zn-finger protein